MASKAVAEKWLRELTHLPTASGVEDAVVAWVRRWAGRRPDLKLTTDSGGNLLITQKGRKRRAPVLAVAHMDHPAFVVTAADGREATFEFRGGVTAEYFDGAGVRVVSRNDGATGRVTSYDSETKTGAIRLTGGGSVAAGDIAMWRFRAGRAPNGRLAAPACDDLAGCAAALAALDRARGKAGLRHFGVLLTRAEEVGLLGAIHACRHETIPRNARILSIETSRELPDAVIGKGPVIRTGDLATVFDRELTNRISKAASGIRHQRKLMSGGTCEATAFGAYGYQAAGLCIPLGNYHNRGNLDAVEAGHGRAVPKLEEVAFEDFHGLVALLLVAAKGVDVEDGIRESLDSLYEQRRHLLA